MNKTYFKYSAACVAIFAGGTANAITFETDYLMGNFDSSVTAGIGLRASGFNCNLITENGTTGPSGAGAPDGCIQTVSGFGDQGDLNYKKGQAFTEYVKGTHELLLRMPDEGLKFLGRVSWLRDFAATNTTDYVSASNPSGVGNLTPEASQQLREKTRLLDLWVSKDFSIGDNSGHVRAGNQVINWGESLFIPGGINQTNSIDYMRLSQPGTQLKEVYLPAPMVSVVSGLGNGLNIEAYYQFQWNASYFPPTGSYWSVVNGLGSGAAEYGLENQKPKKSPQFGVAAKWQPEGTNLNFGAYYENYTDKTPNLSLGTPVGWVYKTDRQLFGVSANAPFGPWALGTELSYRPRDAVSLNPGSGCTGNAGNCFVDQERYQWAGTGILSLTPGDPTFGKVLDILRADTATLMVEAVAIDYPGLKQTYNGDPVAAGAWNWGQLQGGAPIATGTPFSWGYNFDLSAAYDGSLIKGWVVTPEVYYYRAVHGRTPNILGQFMEGAYSANFIVTFAQNPAKWVFALNYGIFGGGASAFEQPLKDRNFLGAYVTRNF